MPTTTSSLTKRRFQKKRQVFLVFVLMITVFYTVLQKRIFVLVEESLQQHDGGMFRSPNQLFQQQHNTNSQEDLQGRRISLGPTFYNIYIPNNDSTAQPELEENAWRIVKEQMAQRSMSADPTCRVIYTLIGPKSQEPAPPVCPECQLNMHLEAGNEENTLQALYEYCYDQQQQTTNDTNSVDDELVTYIHNKGSFHRTEHNEKTRRTATKAAFDCRTEMYNKQSHSPYNVCAGTLVILPQYLCNANMWTAKCSYIRKLIPPAQYARSMQQFYNDTLLHPQLGQTRYKCLQPIHWKGNHLGLGRYAYERWVWNHPDVVPADIIPMGNINLTNYPPTWKPRLSRSLKGSPKRMALHQGFGISSFARLEGRLLEWDYLYHKRPSNSSWIWSYYKGYETGTPAFKILHCGEE